MAEHQTMSSSDATTQHPNRLIHEKSPYLLQHAYNPVDWYPWGEEAFTKARQEQKPIFLSIGYSTCHWCHVMEHESFENPSIARLLNQSFVCIKVDREEHPDVDQVYMSAVTALSGQGGWPLTVFLTPELKPFFGGTYFPPERRGNMPGLQEVLPSIAKAWESQRDKVLLSATQLTKALHDASAPGAHGVVSVETLDRAFQQAVNLFDPTQGGFGEAPKFPRAHELSFLLHYWARTQDPKALEMVTTTLDHLARGGIHDHLGGGFHRYSTDAEWLVPHFEKMLYDQALLAIAYLEAYRATQRTEYAHVARGIFEYVLRDLTSSEGAWYAGEDADSEGQEGTFYVWTPAAISEVLGAEDAVLFSDVYGVTPRGNFEHGTSILHLEQPLETVARRKGLTVAQLTDRLTGCRDKLLAVRAKRSRPHRDEKILTSWNGLMLAAFADGASTLDEPRYRVAAERAAEFLLTHLKPEGTLLRRYREGDARYAGTLEDYAFLSYGLFELYEATFHPRYLAQAKVLVDQMIDQCWDEPSGGFWLRSKSEPQLILRSKDAYDGATPSGNSVAACVLLRLGRLIADRRLETLGQRTLEVFAGTLQRAPFGSPQLLIAADVWCGPLKEVVVAGDPSARETQQFIAILHQRLLPRVVIALHPAGEQGTAIEALIPFIKAQGLQEGRPTAYVCQQGTCQLPTTTLDTFVRLLQEKW